jgi:RadC-like JAB domain
MLCYHEVSRGVLDASLVHPREIFKPAVLSNAAAIVIGHNHPSGDPTPSHDDLELTARLVKAGQLLGIEVLDHIIIGHDGRYCSLRELGQLAAPAASRSWHPSLWQSRIVHSPQDIRSSSGGDAMTHDPDTRAITVSVAVTVSVDPDDSDLIDRLRGSATRLSIPEVIAAEIESHLESVSYVTRVSVTVTQP